MNVANAHMRPYPSLPSFHQNNRSATGAMAGVKVVKPKESAVMTPLHKIYVKAYFLKQIATNIQKIKKPNQFKILLATAHALWVNKKVVDEINETFPPDFAKLTMAQIVEQRNQFAYENIFKN